jgi:hypothetical protein
MKSFALVSLLLSACAHDSGGSAGAAGPENVPAGKYALHLKLNPGEVRKYQVEVKVQTKVMANDAPMFEAPMLLKFLAVLETGPRANDGTTQLKERVENLEVHVEGPFASQLEPLFKGLDKVAVISNLRPDGSVMSSKTEGADGNEALEGTAKQMFQGARFTFLPKSPVGPGDTWTTEEKSPLDLAGKKVDATVKSTLKFVGVEACGDKQCARVEDDSETAVLETADTTGGGKGHTMLMIEIDSGRAWKSNGEQNLKYQLSRGGQAIDVQNEIKYTSERQQ